MSINQQSKILISGLALMLAATPVAADRRTYEHVHKDAAGNIIDAPGHDHGTSSGSIVTEFLNAESLNSARKRGQDQALQRLLMQRQLRAMDLEYAKQLKQLEGAGLDPNSVTPSKEATHATVAGVTVPFSDDLEKLEVRYIKPNFAEIVQGPIANIGQIIVTRNCPYRGKSSSAYVFGSTVVFGSIDEKQMIFCHMKTLQHSTS